MEQYWDIVTVLRLSDFIHNLISDPTIFHRRSRICPFRLQVNQRRLVCTVLEHDLDIISAVFISTRSEYVHTKLVRVCCFRETIMTSELPLKTEAIVDCNGA